MIQRKEIHRLVRMNPGLRNTLPIVADEVYKDAVEIASIETGLPESTFPETSPYSIEEVMGE